MIPGFSTAYQQAGTTQAFSPGGKAQIFLYLDGCGGHSLPVNLATHISVRPVEGYQPPRRHWWSLRRPRPHLPYVALYVDGVPYMTGHIVSLRHFSGESFVGIDRL